MGRCIEFFVPGVPVPGGSKRAFTNRKTGKPIITDASKSTRPWMSHVASVAAEAMRATEDATPLSGPIRLTIEFVLPRPKGHYGTGKNAGKLKPGAPYLHTKRPDATKLLRSTEDALSNICWKDDSQVAIQRVRKVYGPEPGASVQIEDATPELQLCIPKTRRQLIRKGRMIGWRGG